MVIHALVNPTPLCVQLVRVLVTTTMDQGQLGQVVLHLAGQHEEIHRCEGGVARGKVKEPQAWL